MSLPKGHPLCSSVQQPSNGVGFEHRCYIPRMQTQPVCQLQERPLTRIIQLLAALPEYVKKKMLGISEMRTYYYFC